MDKEYRNLNEQLVSTNDEEMIIEGYAIVFDSPATHGGFTEIIDRHALDNCDMKDVPLKYNHEDSHNILARTRNGSLTLTVDDKGLFIRAKLIDTQSNKDIFKMIKAGLLDKQSFAFTTREDSYNYDTDTRTVLDIDKLYDVSVVDIPFYDATSIYARKVDSSDEYFKERTKEKRNKLANKLAREELLKRL